VIKAKTKYFNLPPSLLHFRYFKISSHFKRDIGHSSSRPPAAKSIAGFLMIGDKGNKIFINKNEDREI
jgi:hypothetical protein